MPLYVLRQDRKAELEEGMLRKVYPTVSHRPLSEKVCVCVVVGGGGGGGRGVGYITQSLPSYWVVVYNPA